jgi:kojibiose phosphorylase
VLGETPPSILLPEELAHPFRLVVFDWDGTAVAARDADATRVAGLLDGMLAIGARLAVVTGTNLGNVARQLGDRIAAPHARRLFVCANRGSEAFGFDRRGAPVLLFRRAVTPAEDALLDAVVDGVAEQLTRLTGLSFPIVRDRLNRRKIDLIPELRDPPKSAIAELLAATEARLRGAGLAGGIRAAIELTEHRARDLGFADAKITSDVKHVEVGLTDKGDATRWVFEHVAAPLRIDPAHVLLVGDELGPVAGFAGSDEKMLDVPGASGAVVVSVGPEPGGVPAAVIHLGGGPDRFCEVLERQLALDAELGAFAPPRDASWLIEEPGFDVAREHEIESLLAFANGYVGSRGSLAEGTSVSRPGTFLAGAFEPSADPTEVPELVVLPDWGRLRLVVEGEPFSVEGGQMVQHHRVLDLRRGVLLRDGVERGPAGHVTRMRTLHLASLADCHVLVEAVEVRPQNYSGTVRVDAVLTGDVRSESGASHWESFVPGHGLRGPTLVGRTRGGLVAALASHLEAPDVASGEARIRREIGPTWSSERCELTVRVDERCALYRTVALYSSRDTAEPERAAEGRCAALGAEPPSRWIARHEAAWAERWRRADVTIDGAPGLERALRFAAYHLISAASPHDPGVSIGARALTGEAYRGHVFWDTEIFMLPFFLHTFPEAARALLAYRHRTLPGARRKARALGYAGALYAWESADTGDETTPAAVISPFGEVIRVLSGEQEHHISADVVWALGRYVEATGDVGVLGGEGLEILVETARFWASRVTRGEDGLFHIRTVIGPDEYHEGVDDNAFTNWMARANLRLAADAALAAHLEGDEPAAWRAVADAMYLGLDEGSGLIEQFAGFHALERVDLTGLRGHHPPADVVLGRARTQRAQVVKQADVVQLVALLWDELAPEVRRRCFLHYEPLCVHGSSLSPGIHALVAARLGLMETAERYLEQTAEIDLGNTMGNAAGGVHAAALGSLWQAVVLGVGGVRPAREDREALVIEPNLPPSFRGLDFPFAWRGGTLRVHLEAGAIEVALEGAAPLSLWASGRAGSARVRACPGRRYAARRRDEGFSPWEEIS